MKKVAFLPAEVIRKILLRLPIKACLNSKLVCKSWYNIIMDPMFSSDFHVNGSRGSRVTLLLMDRSDDSNFMVVELNNINASSNIPIDESGFLRVSDDNQLKLRFNSRLNNFPKYQFGMGIGCEGVICFRGGRHCEKLVIINLMTKESVTVEQPRHRDSSGYSTWARYELGCCPVSHNFKLLRILTTYGRNAKVQNVLVDILNIGSGGGDDEWRSLQDAPSLNSTDEPSAFLHGSIHWWCLDNNTILAFNFGDEQFFRILAPDGIIGQACMSTFYSKLCLSCIFSNSCEIWLMKEYRAKSSWLKQYVISTGHNTSIQYVPLFQMENGKVLMKSAWGYNLAIYDPNNWTCETVMVPGLPKFQAMLFDVRFAKLLDGALH